MQELHQNVFSQVSGGMSTNTLESMFAKAKPMCNSLAKNTITYTLKHGINRQLIETVTKTLEECEDMALACKEIKNMEEARSKIDKLFSKYKDYK